VGGSVAFGFCAPPLPLAFSFSFFSFRAFLEKFKMIKMKTYFFQWCDNIIMVCRIHKRKEKNMNSIKIQKRKEKDQSTENDILSFESVKKAYEFLGASSVMNNDNGIKFIENKGYEIVSYDKENTKSNLTIIEKLIKQVSVIDKDELEKLEKEKIELYKSMSPSLLKTEPKELEKILTKIEKIEKEIEKVKNPKADLKSIQDYIEKLFKEYQEKNA